jgi:hypothetical protein
MPPSAHPTGGPAHPMDGVMFRRLGAACVGRASSGGFQQLAAWLASLFSKETATGIKAAP